MRSRLISVLQQSVQRSQKFADYNFRNYFVAKYATKLEQVETDNFGPITEEILNKAEADLEMLIRQTTIQEIDHYMIKGSQASEFWLKFLALDLWFLGITQIMNRYKQLFQVEPTVVEHQKQNL